MKKVLIDQDGCIGCESCVSICPDVFEMNEENIAEVYNQPEEITQEVIDAIEECPTMVISLEE